MVCARNFLLVSKVLEYRKRGIFPDVASLPQFVTYNIKISLRRHILNYFHTNNVLYMTYRFLPNVYRYVHKKYQLPGSYFS